MALEQFVDELLRLAAEKKYYPTTFMRMRNNYGTVEAIRRLVESSEPQSGFTRLKALNMTEWSLESAVLKHPGDFKRKTIEFAQARLDGVLDK